MRYCCTGPEDRKDAKDRGKIQENILPITGTQ